MIQKVEWRGYLLLARAASKEPRNIHKEVAISVDRKHTMIVCREENRSEKLTIVQSLKLFGEQH